METTDIEREVKSFLIANFLFGRADALRDNELLLGKVIDSTGVIELVSFLQERFNITVEDDEVIPENLESVESVVAYVARKLRN